MSIPRRELVQLAEVYDPAKHSIAGWYISEKLDGTRMFWDGGVTRGLRTTDVPWAGIYHPKTTLLKDKIKPVATGLWSRYGNPIMAPDSFLDALPPCPLDGEGWAGRGNFQLCRSILGGDEPDPRFDQIKFKVYGCPPIATFTRPGLIKNPQMYREIGEDTLQWFLHTMQARFGNGRFRFLQDDTPFANELTAMEEVLEGCNVAEVHRQYQLPEDEAAAVEMANNLLERWVEAGAEGAIVRSGTATYNVKRVKTLLKMKPSEDDEGTLVGFTAGKGKYEGMIGALVLDYKGKRLELSGMTDAERQFNVTSGQLIGGKDVPVGCIAAKFEVGQKITFTYRELSDDGIPKEARYLRVRGDE